MPRKTATAGQRFRTAVEREYDDLGDASSLALLHAVCATLDEVELLEASVRADGVTIQGARGQAREHPGLGALVKHRLLLARLTSELFPDDGKRETMTQLAQRAARARWARQKR